MFYMGSCDVIHLVSSLKIGGAERFVIDLAIEQKRLGMSVAILSFSPSSDPLVDIVKAADIPVYFIHKRWWNKTFTLKRQLEKYRFVHCHSVPVMQCIFIVLPFLRNNKFIYTRHGERLVHRNTLGLIHHFARPFVDVVTYVSEGAKEKFLKLSHWYDKPMCIVENGVNPDLFQQVKLPENDIVRFGTVGRLIPLKAQQHLLEAANGLSEKQKSQCELHFIGDGPSKVDIEVIAKSSVTDLNYTFHGTVLDRDTIFSQFDVLVVNSETEGLSIAIIEAMAYGIPVIATNVGGNPRLILNDKTGWLYPYADIASLTAIISSIIDNKAMICQRGDKARQHIEDNFSIKKACKIYNELYGYKAE